MTAITDRKATLEARLQDLTARMVEIEATLDAPAPRDWEEAAVEREGDEVLESMGLESQQEVRAIEAALGRIAEGSYGFCTICGSEITAERLDVVPQTPFCTSCAKAH